MSKTAFWSRSLVILCIILLALGCRDHRKGVSEGQTQEERYRQMWAKHGITYRSREEYLALVDSVFRADHSALSYACYASVFRADGDYERALRYTDTALSLITLPDEKNVSSYTRFVRAGCYDEMGQKDNAIRELKMIIATGPKESADGAREYLCRLYYYMGRFKDALADLPDTLSNEGEFYVQMCKEALDSCERIHDNNRESI